MANADKGSVLQREAWEAAPVSCRAAMELFGADNAHPISQVTPQIPPTPTCNFIASLVMLQLTAVLAVYCFHHSHSPDQQQSHPASHGL